MSDPIKRSTQAAVVRADKTDDIDAMQIKDAEFDTGHSINDEFGYPLWSHPKDQSRGGNTDGDTEPVDPDSCGDDNAE